MNIRAMRRIPHFLIIGLSLAAFSLSAHAQRPEGAPQKSDPSGGLRGDIENQKKISDIDEEIAKTWQTVQEIRQRAQDFRLTVAQIKDVLDNPNCAVGVQLLESLNRARQSNVTLSANLKKQCAQVDAKVQPSLAEACSNERRTLSDELTAIQGQENIVRDKCPSLKK